VVNHKKLNVYLPEELYQALLTYKHQQQCEGTSEAVEEILAQFFHKDNQVKRYATVEQVKALEHQVTHLNQQVAQLYQLMASSTPTQIAKTVTIEADDTFVAPSYEELEDEPDEILYDFLEPGSPPPHSGK
jgi:hypothetical protein